VNCNIIFEAGLLMLWEHVFITYSQIKDI